MIYGSEFFTLHDWKQQIDNKYLTPNDGSAQWAELVEDAFVRVIGGDPFRSAPPDKANGVVWYNK